MPSARVTRRQQAQKPAEPNPQDVATLNAFIDKYADNPVLFVKEVFGADPDPWQEGLLEAYGRRDRRILVRSGHLVGKTCALSWVAIHQFLFRFPQKTICTAASEGQLKSGLIAEIKAWIAKLPALLQTCFTVKVERIERPPEPQNPAASEESFIEFVVSKAENPEALAGRHSEFGYVLLIVDEASGVPDEIFESAGGSMADRNAIMIMAGNPVRNTGFFFESFTNNVRSAANPQGWTCFHVSTIDSKRASRDFVESEKQYGETSNRYRIRVLGEPPLKDENSIISYELATLALDREVKPVQSAPIIWGLDCARGGADLSCLARRRGNWHLGSHAWETDDTMLIVGYVKAQYDMAHPMEKPSLICVDVIGIGAGVCDRLKELQLPARGINVSETPSLQDRYLNLRTELWFKGKEWLERRDCSLNGDKKLRDELATTPYKVMDSNGKMRALTKDEMKKLGMKSPNRADAFLLTLAVDQVTALHGSDRWNALRSKGPMRRVIGGLV